MLQDRALHEFMVQGGLECEEGFGSRTVCTQSKLFRILCSRLSRMTLLLVMNIALAVLLVVFVRRYEMNISFHLSMKILRILYLKDGPGKEPLVIPIQNSDRDPPFCALSGNNVPCRAAKAQIGINCGLTDTQRRRIIPFTFMNRSNWVYLPHPRPAGKLPAVFVLHSSGTCPWRSANDAMPWCCSGWAHVADERGFLVVWPPTSPYRSPTWGYQADIPFFESFIHRLQDGPFSVDAQRVFVTGWSSGASMALFLGSQTDLFNAASSVEGAVGQLDQWSLAKRGGARMIVFQNYNDGAVGAGNHAKTVEILTRHGPSRPLWEKCLPASGAAQWAKLSYYLSNHTSELALIRWANHGTCLAHHGWPRKPHVSFDATYMMADFFLNSTIHWAEYFQPVAMSEDDIYQLPSREYHQLWRIGCSNNSFFWWEKGNGHHYELFWDNKGEGAEQFYAGVYSESSNDLSSNDLIINSAPLLRPP